METPNGWAGARRRGAPLSRLLGAGVLVSLVLMGGCTWFTPNSGATTRVLQTIDVGLDPSGKIASLSGTAMLLDERGGEVRSEVASYEPERVVGDLPLRVSTKYRTEDSTGSDLRELTGHSGRIEIDLTLENLTVAPQTLSYDAAGVSHTAPALVGVPLSIAASAELGDTPPSSMVFGNDEPRLTNGVVSAGEKRGSVVQWGTILAPPQTDAAATLRLVADVEDFAVPDFTISVQTGIHTDLSFEGVLATSLATGKSSPLATQQQAIELVSRVNDVLARAGATVTDIREDLNDTSGVLGMRAAQRLRESTEQLTAEMRGIGAQLTALQESLSDGVNGSASTMNAELLRIVRTMSSLLGETTGSPPRLFTGGGCAAELAERETDGTVFATFLNLSALLTGYAEVAGACRDDIVAALNRTIGPERPSAESCSGETPASASCAVYLNWRTMMGVLGEILERGEALAAAASTASVDRALEHHRGRITPALDELGARIAGLQQSRGDASALRALLADIAAARTANQALAHEHAGLVAVRDALDRITRQHISIAKQICELETTGDAAAQDALSARLVGTACDGTPVDEAALEGGASLVAQILTEQEAIGAVTESLDRSAEESAVGRTDRALTALAVAVNDIISSVEGGDGASQQAAAELAQLMAEVTASSDTAEQLLLELRQEQLDLMEQINAEFSDASVSAVRRMSQDAAEQVGDLNHQRQRATAELRESYRELIDRLRGSATGTLDTGRTLVGEQRTQLDARQRETTRALSERTALALRGIEESTAASTRDVESARLLLADSLNNVLLDLGDPLVPGSGILGAVSASAAKSDTADYQLAQASQRAAGYANVREEDIAGILLRNAQFRAALERAQSLPLFHLEVPEGATSQTIYVFAVSGAS